MQNYISRILIICLVSGLSSCKFFKKGSKSDSAKAQEVAAPPKPAAKQVPQPPYHPSKTLANDLIHTKLEVSFDWERQHLNGMATLSFKPYFYPQDSLILDAKGFDIHEVVLMPGKKALKYNYDDKRKLKIKLDKTYFKEDTFTVYIKYTAKPNDLPQGGSEAITSDKGLYFINPLGKEPNKPKQIWTQGETESSSCWFPTIDTPNERSTQEMYITADTAYSIVSNGEFIYSTLNGNGTKTDYWKMTQSHAPYLFMMAIGKYAIIKDEWRDMEVNYYVEPAYAPYAKAIFGNTPEMLEFFSTKLNYKYPWPKYSEIVARDYVSGAMENTTATIFYEALQVDDRQLLDENWDYIIAHELFHHWFGDLVTCESWANLPLNESFANYSEYLWGEHKKGVDEADYHEDKERAEFFDEAQHKQVPLIRYHYTDREDMFDRHSYNKGGAILHMLRKYLGDDAFFKSLNLYLKRNEYTPVEVHDLRLAFEDVTGEDLNWYFNQWFMSAGFPILKISQSHSNGSLKLHVEQLQDTTLFPIYRLPVLVDVWENGTKTQHKITINKAVEDISMPALFKPELVVFDSENQLLGKVDFEKTVEEWRFQYYHGDRYLTRKAALNQILTTKGTPNASAFNDPENRKLLHAALKDNFWAIRDMALDQFGKVAIPEPTEYIKDIEQMAIADPKPQVRAKAIMLLTAYAPQSYTDIYLKGIQERPYSIVAASLSGLLKTGYPGIAGTIKEYEKSNDINIVVALAEYFVSVKDDTRFDWFVQKMTNGNDRELYNVMPFFAQYLNIVDVGRKEEGKALLKKISETNKHDVIKSMAAYYLKSVK